MGKKQHQKDKLYITHTEWQTEWGGKKAAGRGGSGVSAADISAYRRLPFDHCSLSLQPWEVPYCDREGHVFDLVHIVPYVKKFKANPVTGKKLEASSLTKLKVHKNSSGEIHCPVMFKVFNNNTHIVANAKTGNVYSMEAVDELNIKTKNWKDLLTDEPFTRSDLITLQDPTKTDKSNINTFHHLKHDLRVKELEDAKDPRNRLKTVNAETKESLKELDRTYVAKEKEAEAEEERADKTNAAHYSTGRTAQALTSTYMPVETESRPAVLEEDVVRYARVKKKGYVRLTTNVGPLNLELHCEYTPKTCENFIKLAQRGYYNGTKFHRSIRHFMIQGGDPNGSGFGGQSAWGKKPFKDEFQQFLNHSGRGILSMANTGPNTNTSQFFITYRSCNHLDKKHTVFGKVVGGIETLNALEAVETDNKDRPISDLIIERATVFVDPYTEVDEQLAKERQEEAEKNKEKEKEVEIKKSEVKTKVYTKGIGKFINPSLKREAKKTEASEDGSSESKKARKAKSGFSDFSGW